MNVASNGDDAKSVYPISVTQLLADQPPIHDVDIDVAAIRADLRLVVLDDDPTGTQTVADLPVLTSWTVNDLRWALSQQTTGFFVLTNTRSLNADDAADRNCEIVDALERAAQLEGQIRYVLASRSDSTLRGHFPLETDVLTRELETRGTTVDGVIICPAYVEAGRLTVDSMHWARTNDGMVPVAQTEYAQDASFGYHNSDLRNWVVEKSEDQIARADIITITLADIRIGGSERVETILRSVQHGQPVVIDTAADADQRVVTKALLRAEGAGHTFIYRIGPSFARARTGQLASRPVEINRLSTIRKPDPPTVNDGQACPDSNKGLIVVGSHVALTSRQLDQLRVEGGITELELHVPTLLDPIQQEEEIADLADTVTRLLKSETHDDVVIRTSRELVTGDSDNHSLEIARAVSTALTAVVQRLITQVRPSFILAKGGITASDIATCGLGITRAWCRGTMLPGIVSLWAPEVGPAQGIPYIVFAGNVGDEQSLAQVVHKLR